ncbi:inositol 2-dehydrogenase [Garciella nitratireducens]|uniref:inositol 2-dehydrogenase n=1 Tax=Garciella nitratireducens TaxID=218205 RepID=UPI000DEB3411|nr:inositol 2-dehydrogenase [Garciella nitratireducens]RBP46871.1 myo-inositol 2-dehydrogenase [Garciella nitratireducens]
MKNQIVVGVVGAGRIGQLHINNMKMMSNIRVKTVADVFADKLKDWFETSGAEKLTKDYQDIMNDPEIDVVFICSSTDTHTMLIKEAAKVKKHIFCEKPISFSDQETLEAYEVVKAAGVKMQVGFNRRFDKNFKKIKNYVKSKKIGDLHILKITSRDPEPPSLDYVARSGGIFMDMAIHDFDMARYVSGSEVEEVYVQGATLVNPDIQKYNDIDTAIITLKFENGAIGVIDNSRQAVYGYDQRVEAFGSQGAISADNETETRVKVFTKDTVEEDKPLYFFLERYNDAYIQEVQDFFDSIEQEKEVLCEFKDGIMAQRIAKAAKKSFEIGKPVKVEKLK